MTPRVLLALLAISGLGTALSPSAMAIGCVTGGAAGAVAGHMAHHAVLGAVGGCVAGHEYKKHQQRAEMQNRYDDPRRNNNLPNR